MSMTVAATSPATYANNAEQASKTQVDYQSFLKLLVAQMKNQDPTNPMDSTQYMAQLQTGLLVTGRQWIDYVSFAGGMALWPKRVTPIPAWQTALTHAARTAEAAIRELTERYRAAVHGLPVMERIPDAEEISF